MPLRAVCLCARRSGTRLFFDCLRGGKALCLHLCLALRLGCRLCRLLGDLLCLGFGARILLSGFLCRLGSLRLSLRSCLLFLDSLCGSFFLPLRHDDNFPIQVRIETFNLLFLTEGIHDQTKLVGVESAGRGLALDAVFGENCNHILALDAKLLCQLVDTVLLILCHASFTLLRGCAKILSFYQMLSNAGNSGGLIL